MTRKCKVLRGIPASPGIAIGPLTLCADREDRIERKGIQDPEAEIARMVAAREQAVAVLHQVYEDARDRVGDEDSMIFQIHITMLEDEDFYDTVCETIRTESVCAEFAVGKAAQKFADLLSAVQDEYMQGRSADVLDASRRLLHALNPKLGRGKLLHLEGATVVAATDLMPSEAIKMDHSQVLAVVTERGSKSSHSAILARTMGIPAVVGMYDTFRELEDDAIAIVDGEAGVVIVDPDEDTLREYERKRREYLLYQYALQKLKGTRSVSRDGVSVAIGANIGTPKDLELVLRNDAESIGLFRSEFLYMENGRLPTEEQQFQAYRTVLEKMKGRRVIIRTLDAGADKHLAYLRIPKEENPAMGYRSIRISLDRKDLFQSQLRAMLRASIYGRMGILFPMITSPGEVQRIEEILEEVRAQLWAERVPFAPDIEMGIMIETPAAVMLADELAKEVDFFSIGTNDLTQYTLAVDRLNPIIASMYNPRHPAVLRMIEKAVKSAKAAGIWVGICGESAADTTLTKFYLSIGVDELSVAPSAVLAVRRAVQETTVFGPKIE